MRLQVFLSRSGVASRRRAMEIVFGGRVEVNGRVVREPSCDVKPGEDQILCDGRPVGPGVFRYILLNKPAGVITTRRDPHAPRTVMDLLPPQMRVLAPVGRLDKDTTGLLLLTNDGDLAHRMTHPSFEKEKVYRVLLDHPLGEADRVRFENGIMIGDATTAPARAKILKGAGVEVAIKEGRKRQVRRMFAILGYEVLELERVRFGPLELGSLNSGEWRELSPVEAKALRQAAGL